MNESERRLLKGKLAGIEGGLLEAYKAIHKVEQWVASIRRFLEETEE